MKNTVLRYGGYATTFLIVVNIISWLAYRGKEPNYTSAEVIGYLVILVSLVFVFLGIKQYREVENGGQLKYWEGVKVGLLIAVLPSLAFGLFNLVYTYWLDPGFMDNYFAYNLEQLKASLPADEYTVQEAALLDQKEFFMNPMVNFTAMFFSVFILGGIVSMISAMVLRK